MRVCPHCRALVADDNVEICPKCKSNMNLRFDKDGVHYEKKEVPDKKSVAQKPPKSKKVDDERKQALKHAQKPKLQANSISLSSNASAKFKKFWWLIPVAIVYIALIIMIIMLIISAQKDTSATIAVNANSGDNYAAYDSRATVATPDDRIDKKVEDITYDAASDEYCLQYKTLPAFFENLNVGDVFIAEANENARIEAFKFGFSGRITDMDKSKKDGYVKFIIPDFTEIFDKLSISTADGASVTNVSFKPTEGFDIQPYAVPMALGDVVEKFSFGGLNTGFTYKEADKDATLDGYDVLAKQIKLKVGVEEKLSDEAKLDISGEITLDYPAFKFAIDYDEIDGVPTFNSYDIGFVTKEKTKLEIDAKGEYGLKSLNKIVEDIPSKTLNILDISDTLDEEPGKIVLGTFLVGIKVPIAALYNTHNMVDTLSFGIAFQLAVTIGGELELKYDVEHSSFIQITDSSDNGGECLIKNYDYPNPVFGEVLFDETKNVDEPEIKNSLEGSATLKIAFSPDIGICVLGTVPMKLVNDLLAVEIVREFSFEDKKTLDAVADSDGLIDSESVSFYQVKTQSYLLFNFQVEGIVCDFGKMTLKKNLFTYVHMQVPNPVDFDDSQCNFGGISVGKSYTRDEMNEIFYERLDKKGKLNISDQMKDKFIQQSVEKIANKINFSQEDIMEMLELKDSKYDVVCYAEGAIYLMENNNVVAEIIFGKNIDNSSNIVCGSSENFVRQTYSEPDDFMAYEVRFGELAEKLLLYLEMDALLEYDDTNISCYVYESKNSNNELVLFFDTSGDVIFALCG